jgi:Stage II sporulation protein E (SpoIIE)/GAF domain/Domain of unknown function (DUF4118)
MRWFRSAARRWRLATGTLLGVLACVIIVIAVPHDVGRVLIPGEVMLLAVVLATVVGGPIAGGVVLAGSAIALFYFFIPEPDSFTGADGRDYISIVMYLAVGAVLVGAVAALITARDRVRRERARLRSLLHISRHFDLELDVDATLGEVARAIVPTLCDVCVIDILEGGEFRRAASATSSGYLTRYVNELRRHAPDVGNLSHPAVTAVTTKRPVIVDDITAEVLDAAANTPLQRRATAFLRGGSAIVVPILGDGQAVGAISLARTNRSTQPFDGEDVSFAVELATRAGEALERARVHEEVRDAFVEIQRALLPERLPTVGGVSVSALYEPAHAATVVGGDWYAVVPIDDSHLGIAIGDAAGSGLQASAQMARVRYALLALARSGREPSDLLAALNDYLFAIGQDSFVTVTYGVLDSERRTWAEARAGHLPTMLRSPEGRACFLERHAGGLPLGVARDARYRTLVHELPTAATLLLYTDGLCERRGEDLDHGLERLHRTFESLTIDDPDEACATIADKVAGPDRDDDVALLMTTLERTPRVRD